MNKVFILIGFAFFLASLVACRQQWLTNNTFLDGFITFEIISLLSVMLTVTLASVANIHLWINKLVADHMENDPNQKKIAEEIKLEIKENAIFIFYAFILSILILFVKGATSPDGTIDAICNALILWLLLFTLLSVYDIYKVIYGIVDIEAKLEKKKNDQP